MANRWQSARKSARWFSALALVSVFGCSEAVAPSIEERQDPEALGILFEDFALENGISAGILAIMRHGEVVYERAVGWRDREQTETLQPAAPMRLASVTKPITASAIRTLIDAGLLSLTDRVFDVGQPEGGVLDLVPFPSLGDPRLADVTIRHLLEHRGGWDRDLVGDLTYRERQVADAMGVASPPGRRRTVEYILGQPLEFTPGAREAYSNVGYLVLGLIVEEVSGIDYLTYVHQSVFGPLGVAENQVFQGRTFSEDRDPREPWYDSQRTQPSVFLTGGPTVAATEGGWDHEARISQGGLVASASAILALLDSRVISGNSIGLERTGTEGPGWRRNHTGSLPGTNTLARQRGDGINFVVLFNSRPASGPSYASSIRTIIDARIDRGIRWPE